VFSPQEYELAARILGLPVPITPAEQAAAAPMTAVVMRNFCQTLPPAPGQDDGQMMNMGATHSLNAYPDNTQPAYRNQLMHRLQAGVIDTHQEQEVFDLIEMITNNPEVAEMFMNFLSNLQNQGDEHMQMLSSQRPPEYDMPNYGSNYSLLNAPTNSIIPPSQAYSELG
jgi:hypothetical protein